MNSIAYFETLPRKVYFADTDAAGVVHHSNYIRWFEVGRIDLLDSLGCTYASLQAKKIGFVPVSLSVTYKYPLRFGDLYRIRTSIVEIKKVRFFVHAEIVSQEDKVCCTSDIWLACMDESTWAVCQIPGEVLQVLSQQHR